MNTRSRLTCKLLLVLACMGATPALRAQTVIYEESGPEPLAPEVMEQLVAPIALYSDALLAQILMASTYPIEVVQADRWVRGHQHLAGDALIDALELEPWDPSVKSLVNFPQILAMMNENLGWTTELGDAFLADQEGLMVAVQRLRYRAHREGNLRETEQQRVIIEDGGSTTTERIIVIESVKKEVVYVPVYDPLVVYGHWPYSRYRPFYYRPPGYSATAVISFGSGFRFGAAWGYAWGGCDWRDRHISIDIHRHSYVRHSHRINRVRYQRDHYQGPRGTWRHNPRHRRAVPYRHTSTARRYNSRTISEVVRSREVYRGYTRPDRRDQVGRDRDRFRERQPTARPTNRSPSRPTMRPVDSRRSNVRPSDRSDARSRIPADRSDRPAPTARPRGAFGGPERGKSAREHSQRGQASRSKARKPRSGGAAPSRFSRPRDRESRRKP